MRCKVFLIKLLFSFSIFSNAQIQLDSILLTQEINETSGLEYYDDYLITHNDSGNAPRLYVINLEGELVLESTIHGTVNRDWEDLASDGSHYFIADIGNNKGKRKDLTIYILNSKLILVDSINFNYKVQTNFEKRKKHRFDAEALTVLGDSLLLFSKDRKQFNTQLYTIPKAGGNYTLVPFAEWAVGALITAADYDQENQLLALTGYDTDWQQFFYLIPNFILDHARNIQPKKYLLPLEKAQVEAIKIIDKNHFWITSEGEGGGHPRLFKITLE